MLEKDIHPFIDLSAEVFGIVNERVQAFLVNKLRVASPYRDKRIEMRVAAARVAPHPDGTPQARRLEPVNEHVCMALATRGAFPRELATAVLERLV